MDYKFSIHFRLPGDCQILILMS